MKSCFHTISLYRKSISSLLMLAFLVLALSPFHFHLHHADDAGSQGSPDFSHTIDMHVYADGSHVEHHGDAHAIEPTTYINLKFTALQLPLFVVAFALLILLLPVSQPVRHSLLAVSCVPFRNHRYRIPPLRAPPRA